MTLNNPRFGIPIWVTPFFKVAICDLEHDWTDQLEIANCDLKFAFYFFLCTFAATFNRSAFNRMKPVASSWL